MNQSPKRFNELPVSQGADLLRNALTFTPLTVISFLRRDVGFRNFTARALWGTTVVELVFVFIGQVFTTPNETSFRLTPLLVFAVSSFACGIHQRRKRWQEFKRGVRQHSGYLGTSCLNFKWLPMFFRRNRRVERFLDPIFCFVLGTVLLFISPGLGYWLCICGAGLRVVEEDA